MTSKFTLKTQSKQKIITARKWLYILAVRQTEALYALLTDKSTQKTLFSSRFVSAVHQCWIQTLLKKHHNIQRITTESSDPASDTQQIPPDRVHPTEKHTTTDAPKERL